MFDPEQFVIDRTIEREELASAIARLEEDVRMLRTAHAEKALTFIEQEVTTIRKLLQA